VHVINRERYDLEDPATEFLQREILDRLDDSKLFLSPTYGWKIFIDVVVLKINVGSLYDLISQVVLACIDNTTLPKVKVLVNKNTGNVDKEIN
jgi:exosome complex RNA-binding protein Rrp42 (RNase PH superfamily)